MKVVGLRSGTAMKATKVAFDTGDGSDTELDDVDGAITAFTSIANFVVHGIIVDASAAAFANGAASDPAVGKHVKVLGTRTGSLLLATKVTFLTGSASDDDADDDGDHHSGGGGANPGTGKPPVRRRR